MNEHKDCAYDDNTCECICFLVLKVNILFIISWECIITSAKHFKETKILCVLQRFAKETEIVS